MPDLIKYQQGFMLSEIVISMGVIAIGLVSYIHLQLKIMKENAETNQNIIILISAKSAIDLVKINHTMPAELTNGQNELKLKWQSSKLLINNQDESVISVNYAP